MARDDWRIRVELPDEHGGSFLDRLGVLSPPAEELAEELRDRRLAATRDGDTVFVYAEDAAQAQQARELVTAQLREDGLDGSDVHVEQWLEAEDRWSQEPVEAGSASAAASGPGGERLQAWERDLLERGWAPWEVRVECETRRDARELAEQLEAEGYSVVRTWRYVFAGTETREEAEELARRVHGRVEPGGEAVWEVVPQNPFVVFGGLGV